MLQKQNIDWDKLGFNASKTRSMWVGDCIDDETWSRGALEPYGNICLLYTSPSPRDNRVSRMPSSA